MKHKFKNKNQITSHKTAEASAEYKSPVEQQIHTNKQQQPLELTILTVTATTLYLCAHAQSTHLLTLPVQSRLFSSEAISTKFALSKFWILVL